MENFDIHTLLNIQEDDLEILTKNLTPDSDTSEYYKRVEDDYANGKIMQISAMEYKNLVLMEYFVKGLMAGHIDRWIPYKNTLLAAIKQYEMTMNIADKTAKKYVDKVNNLEQEQPLVVDPFQKPEAGTIIHAE